MANAKRVRRPCNDLEELVKIKYKKAIDQHADLMSLESETLLEKSAMDAIKDLVAHQKEKSKMIRKVNTTDLC